MLLLRPRIRQALGETGDREIGRRAPIGDRHDDAGRHEGKRSQQANVSFALGLRLASSAKLATRPSLISSIQPRALAIAVSRASRLSGLMVCFSEWDEATHSSYFKRIKDAVEITIPKLNQLANEQVNMLIGRRWPVDGDHLSLLNFWIEQLGVLFPWTLLIPGGALVSFRVLSMDRRISQPSLLLLLWFFIYAIAITFANLQDYYLLICLPVIAIWLAWAIRRRRCSGSSAGRGCCCRARCSSRSAPTAGGRS